MDYVDFNGVQFGYVMTEAHGGRCHAHLYKVGDGVHISIAHSEVGQKHEIEKWLRDEMERVSEKGE